MFFKSVSFQTKNGKLEAVVEVNNFLHKNHPIHSIPRELFNNLKATLTDSENELFEKFISSKESISQITQDVEFNRYVKESINSFINSLSDEKETSAEDKENFETTYIQSFYGPPVNLMIKLVVDTRLIPSKDSQYEFDINEFTPVNENTYTLRSYSEEDGKYYDSISYRYKFIVSGTKEDLFHDFGLSYAKKDRNIAKVMDTLLHPVANERSNFLWQCLDHFIFCEVKLASSDRLDTDNEKLVSREDLENKNHIVYIARDIDNVVRYIGEGKSDRYRHVNSGVSHVYELNKEHFLGSEMSIEIYNKHLTKFEALSIERFLLNKYKQCGLWNKKDYQK